jgi:hypothetical protein
MKNEKQTEMTQIEYTNLNAGVLLYAAIGIVAGLFGLYITMFIFGGLAVWRALPGLVLPFKSKKDQNKG